MVPPLQKTAAPSSGHLKNHTSLDTKLLGKERVVPMLKSAESGPFLLATLVVITPSWLRFKTREFRVCSLRIGGFFYYFNFAPSIWLLKVSWVLENHLMKLKREEEPLASDMLFVGLKPRKTNSQIHCEGNLVTMVTSN